MENNLYETDYFRWVQKQKEFLLNRQFDQLDLDNLIEEVEDMGRSEPRALESHLTTLILHLLKCHYQTETLQDPWIADKVIYTWYPSINNPRRDINLLLKQNPSLKGRVGDMVQEAYFLARKNAVREMNRYIKENQRKLGDDAFPHECPWDFEQIMSEDWLPGQ